MKFEIKGMDYQDLKEHLDDLVTNHDLNTYKLYMKQGRWVLIVNKRQWLKTWMDSGNDEINTNELIQQSFAEELQGMGYDNIEVRLLPSSVSNQNRKL